MVRHVLHSDSHYYQFVFIEVFHTHLYDIIIGQAFIELGMHLLSQHIICLNRMALLDDFFLCIAA